jgi:CRP-like cAMP-binding protein
MEAGRSSYMNMKPRETKLAYLTENELFRGMRAQELVAIAQELPVTTCESGRIFYSPGESGEVLFILKEGRVERYQLSPEGKKLIEKRESDYRLFAPGPGEFDRHLSGNGDADVE